MGRETKHRRLPLHLPRGLSRSSLDSESPKMDPVLNTPVLDRITRPADLRSLNDSDLRALAEAIRQFLVTSVSKTGGHLGPNLGVVELTLARHRVFESPK